nr:hypothetical protein [Tanacetum cinerariifolium]
ANIDGKLAGLLKASKDLDNLIESQRPSSTVESTLRDDQNRNSSASENGESTNSILSKPAVKFVKAAERKRVKKGTSRSQNKTHESFKSRHVAHRPYRPLVRPVRTNMNNAQRNKTTFNKQAHSYANRPFQRTSAVRPQYRAPWVLTVNRNFPMLTENFPLRLLSATITLSNKAEDPISVSTSALAQVESRLVEYKEREVKYCKKIRTLEFHNESNNECIEILKKKLETLKLEKDGVDGKLAHLLKASKDLDNLIKSQRSDKNKDGLGYIAIPPPPAQLYLSSKKDLS